MIKASSQLETFERRVRDKEKLLQTYTEKIQEQESQLTECAKKQEEHEKTVEALGGAIEKEAIRAFEQKTMIDCLEMENA